MFCDELKIKVIAGKGGNGAATFRREKFIAKGGPDGGDGGRGGDIIIRVNPNINTLSHLAHQKAYRAESGVNGARKNMHGRNAEDLYLEVPPGTVIFNNDKSQALADLNNLGEQVTIVKGGKGGKGNARFVSSTHQAPKLAENGEPGEEQEIVLELKLVADIGIIGLPSAGKSTLISVISNAKPKIAAYHFTTLVPNLGVVDMSRVGGSKNESFVVADIPGLIEGASHGKGLGHQFLKHVSRTKLLIHVLDASHDSISDDFKTINKELKAFDKELSQKEQIVVLNKIDLLDEDTLKAKVKEISKTAKTKQIYQISGLTREGLKPLLFEAFKKMTEIKKEELKEIKSITSKPVILKPHLDTVKFKIDKIEKKKDHKIFKISGKRIEQLIVMTEINSLEGLERIYHYLNKLGILRAVQKAGASYGDIIQIKERNIPYRK